MIRFGRLLYPGIYERGRAKNSLGDERVCKHDFQLRLRRVSPNSPSGIIETHGRGQANRVYSFFVCPFNVRCPIARVAPHTEMVFCLLRLLHPRLRGWTLGVGKGSYSVWEVSDALAVEPRCAIASA